MASKQSVIDFVISNFEKLSPNNDSIPLIREHLEGLSEKAFKAIMQDIKDGNFTIPLYAPNLSTSEVVKGKALDLADELGLELFHRLRLTDPETGETYLTPIEFLVLPMPVRRQEQHLEKKKSLPSDTKKVDHLSGQATGESKGASISLPELLVLDSKNFNESLIELVKVRGGDATAHREMIKTVVETGGYSLGPLIDLGTTAKANETLASILFAMHLDNNLVEK